MKRIILIILTLLMIISLASCGSPPVLKTDFSALFSVERDNTEYAGTLNRNGDHLTIIMKEPYTIAGMVFDYSDTGLSIGSNGHSTGADADYLPDSSVPAALRNALLYLTQASYVGTQNGVDSYTVNTPYGEAPLTASDGYPAEITEPHSGMHFKFTAPSEAAEG